jgi:protein-S-isoprenylcysteine O-methyltransferase Ste14
MRAIHWILMGLAVCEVAVLALGIQSTHAGWPWMRIAGICLLLLTIVWVVVARWQLGGAFSVRPRAHHLVTTGLYKRIRNPIYVVTPFVLVAFALILGRWWPVLLLVVVIPIQIMRARREAEVLRSAFGAEYDQYRAQTWF